MLYDYTSVTSTSVRTEVEEAIAQAEEQLAAVLDALSGVQRLILVGDPRQLPPIGAGRPFRVVVWNRFRTSKSS